MREFRGGLGEILRRGGVLGEWLGNCWGFLGVFWGNLGVRGGVLGDRGEEGGVLWRRSGRFGVFLGGWGGYGGGETSVGAVAVRGAETERADGDT